MVYAYYGDGQGKTSALNGVLLRALSQSKKVLVIRFFKSEKWNQSEDIMLKQLGLNIFYFQEFKGFIWNKNKENHVIESAKNGIDFLLENYQDYDYLFLDEIIDLVTNHLMTSEQFKDLIDLISLDKKVFISGHFMDETIAKSVDVLTFFEKKKHHFDKGVYAIKGIDF